MRARSLLVLWLLVVTISTGCAFLHTPARNPDLVHITLLQVNDIYEIEPVDGGRRGGMARLATLVKEARRENPNTVFVLAGDTLSPSVMSTMLEGEQMIGVLNAVGLDLATPGNHEFDFGPAVLADRMRASAFTWLATNVTDRRTGQPFGTAQRDVIRAMGPLTVGFLGLTMPETAATSSPGPDIVFAETIATGREAAADLRHRGAKLVVALTHEGMARDRALAEAAGIDVILGGHEHEPLVAEEGHAVITKAGSDGRYLVRVDLWVTPGGQLVERSWAFHEVSRRVPLDLEVEKIVQGYVERLDRSLAVDIGRAAVPLEARRAKLRTEETNVGDFLADLMRSRTASDVALLNGGAIRSDRVFPEGTLTRRDVVSLLPFINTVMKLEMRGRDLRRALEHGLAQIDHQGGGFLQISGMRIVWDPRRPAGKRLVRADVNGAPLDDARAYTVAVIDYLYRGGDGFTVFRDGKVLLDAQSGPALTTIVVDAFGAQGTIAPRVDGRISVIGR